MPDSDKQEIDPRLTQVRGEYLEMPGLQLTVAQASRLWDMKPATTERVPEPPGGQQVSAA